MESSYIETGYLSYSWKYCSIHLKLIDILQCNGKGLFP